MLHLRALTISFAVAIALSCGERGFANEKVRAKRHVVVVVWDGMRPDFVSEENTPTLWKLAKEGVIFRNHHAVYPSATNVNGTAMVTGVYPGKNGVIANYVYRPDIDRKRSVFVETPAVVDKGDELSGGKYISFPTIAELVQKRRRTHGDCHRQKPSGFYWIDIVDPDRAKNGVTLFAGKSATARRARRRSCHAWSISVCLFAEGRLDDESRNRFSSGKMACRLFRCFGWGIQI